MRSQKKPVVGQMVQYDNTLDKDVKEGPLAACIVAVLGDGAQVNVVIWDKLGEMFSKTMVPYGDKTIATHSCMPLPTETA
jgi:hypothetical protein